jgi:hypothetical protein
VITGMETAWRKIHIRRYFEKNFSRDIFYQFGSFMVVLFLTELGIIKMKSSLK